MDPLTFAEDAERRKRMLPQALGGTLTTAVQPGQANALPMTLRSRLNKVYEDLAAVDGQDVDTSALQAFAQQQSQSGDAAMLNALAAQFAGESFQPIQAQYLKRAAAAKEPMKMGGGVLTPDGKFMRDPFAQRDARRTSLERQATQLQGMVDRQEKDERDRQDRLAREQDTKLYRDSMLDIQRLNAGQGAENRGFQRATTLRGEYEKKSSKIGEGVRHAETVMTLLSDPTIAQDPTKQVSLVFAFGKMLDPESVVRESEYALIEGARGMFEGLLQKPDQIMTGARLTPQQLQSMQQIARQLYSGAAERRQYVTDYYRDLASRNGVRPEDVIPMGAGRTAAPGGSAPAGAPPAGIDAATWAAMTPQERALWNK